MAKKGIYSWNEQGHTGPAGKPANEPPMRSKIDFLLALSIGSIAIGVLMLVLAVVYLLHGLSAEMLAIWICCGVVASALLMLGGCLFWSTNRILRDRPGKRPVA
jgi:hypothetical protein